MQSPSKKSTIYDVAAKVGTSAATVSRTLSNSGYPVSANLRQRILDAAAELGYTPNVVGRMLKKSTSTDIGILIPTIANPYYSALLLGAEREARGRGYNLFLCNSLRDGQTERNYLESLHQKQVRGILIPTGGDNVQLLKQLQAHGVKIVVFDGNDGALRCGSVSFDYAGGAELAVDHLVAHGHRDIAFLSSPVTRSSRRGVLNGFLRALGRHGLGEGRVLVSESEEELADGAYEFVNGKALAARFLELRPRPTAIVAINDLTAFGIIQELAARGVRVPEDVSIVGFDNIEYSAMINPPLTTVSQPAFETGRLACAMLLDSLAGAAGADASATLRPGLVVRRSVARPEP